MDNTVNTLTKGCLSFVIWGGAIAAGIVAMQSPFLATNDMGVVVMVPFLFALLSMIVIWAVPESIRLAQIRERAKAGEREGEYTEKGKRQTGDKLTLLLEMMDDDEREAFKEALKRRALEDAGYSDGELPFAGETLESLLDDEKRLRR